MQRNKNGFIAISIIFSFFVVFLMVLTINITNYAQNRILMNQIKLDIKDDLGIKPIGKKCRRAKVLHTVDCANTDPSRYCSAAGYLPSGSKQTTAIEYGNLGTTGTLTSGDAFDCDVNGDGIYNKDNERFYYVSPLYNGGTWNTNVAVLIYYSNVSSGEISNSAKNAYHSSNNYTGPVVAKDHLPSKEKWSNVDLQNPKRKIINEIGGSSYSSYVYPTAYSYEDKSSRLLTAQEANYACGITIGSKITGELDNCIYLMENTKFSASSSMGTYGFWLESPYSGNGTYGWTIDADYRKINTYSVATSSLFSTRPVIEVLIDDIEK